jgi:hypothetical protein
MVLVVISAIKLLKRSTSFDPALAGLIAVWIAYQAQSIISLNQLGLAVWGWIISGLIIGYEINTRAPKTSAQIRPPASKGRNVKKSADAGVSSKTLLSMVAGGVIGLLVGLPPFVASAQFKSALKSGDATKLENSAYIWPSEPMRYGQVGLVLLNNKLDAQAQRVVDAGLLKFPDEFGLWSLASKLTTATPEQVAKAKKEMMRLDPNNPDIK